MDFYRKIFIDKKYQWINFLGILDILTEVYFWIKLFTMHLYEESLPNLIHIEIFYLE